MKITNFKMYPLLIAVSAFLALSGCDGTTGIISDSGIGTETPTPTPTATTTVPDAGTSSVTASPVTVVADGTATSTVIVTVNDASSNPITDATVTLDDGAGSSTVSAVINVGDGTYTFDVTSTTADTVTYTATADGVTITQTANVTFQSGVANAGTSTVTSDPASVAADGAATSTVTVTVNDVNSNPITNATVTLDQGKGRSTISVVTNVGDGTYTFNVNSTTVDTVTYTATADGVIITDTADVNFTQTTAEKQCLDLSEPAGYGIITINGRNWLDRNLGAIQVATSINDSDAHGDLYQWGRSSEGHQDRTSDINDTLATTLDNVQNTPWEGKFIVTTSDWIDAKVDNNGSLRSQSWSTSYDVNTNPNQVCPCGYVVPTPQDFLDLNLTAPGATDTFKLTYTGWRYNVDGSLKNLATQAFFWTNSSNGIETSYYNYNNNNEETINSNTKRSQGFSIRCIKP